MNRRDKKVLLAAARLLEELSKSAGSVYLGKLSAEIYNVTAAVDTLEKCLKGRAVIAAVLKELAGDSQ